MEKEEKTIIETVDTSIENNETPIVESADSDVPESEKDENEEVVDDNTTTDDTTVEEPAADAVVIPSDVPVDAPVESTEDVTLAPTDDVIPAPVDDIIPAEEPVLDVPGVDPVIDTPAEPVAEPVAEPIAEPVVDTPVEPVAEPIVEPVVDAPVEPVAEPVIPEDPAVIVPTEPVDAPVEPEDIVGPGPVAVDGCDTCGDTCDCGEPKCDDTCGNECPCTSNVSLGNFFGTLQECVTIVWRFHLKTRIYRYHTVLNDFYEKALDIVDDIIEQYQGICGVCDEPFVNCIVGDGKSEGEYLTELKAFIENNKCVLGDHSEIYSTIDEFLALIDSTNYKLSSFTEGAVKSFEEFVYEDYQAIKESCHYDRYGERHSDDPDDEDYDPEFENGECGAEEE